MTDIDRSARPKVFPTESSVQPQVTMSYTKAELAQARTELAQTRTELTHLQGANREYGRQLADMSSNRDYWYQEAQDNEAETKGLRQQLTDARRVARLWFRRAHELMVEVEITGKEMVQVKRQLRREAEEAEAYVKDCRFVLTNIRSVLDKCQVEGKYDAPATIRISWLAQRAERAEAQVASITQAVEWLWGFWDGNTLVAKPGYEDDIREAWRRLLVARDAGVAAKLLERLAEAEKRAEGALATARKRAIQMGEAERRANKNDNYIKWLHQILSDGGYILSTNEDGTPAIAISPMQELKREKVAAEQRAERAEALAALVTPGLAEMLKRLAWIAEVEKYPVAADHGREFAAKIREVLDDNQA